MSYLLIILVIGLLILVHELGHLLAGKAAGVPIARFSIGFGPKLLECSFGGTTYRLSAIPVGGYVLPRIENEQDYLALPLLSRMLFALCGPLANILLVIALFAMINLFAGGFSPEALLIDPLHRTFSLMGMMFASFSQIFDQPGQMMGIVGMVAEGGRLTSSGSVGILDFTILISLNLAIFNLLPLPPLDGGKILLDLLHRLTPRAGRIYLPASLVGWIFMLGLMLYATALDVGRLVA